MFADERETAVDGGDTQRAELSQWAATDGAPAGRLMPPYQVRHIGLLRFTRVVAQMREGMRTLEWLRQWSLSHLSLAEWLLGELKQST